MRRGVVMREREREFRARDMSSGVPRGSDSPSGDGDNDVMAAVEFISVAFKEGYSRTEARKLDERESGADAGRLLNECDGVGSVNVVEGVCAIE